LPEVIAEGVSHQFSHLVLERLPGTDLGEVIGGLSDSNLDVIATKVAQAQRMTSRAASGTRYGYSVEPGDAPHQSWSQVLMDNLARSRRRIAAAKLFDENVVDAIAEIVSTARAELDALPPVDDLCFGDPRYVVALTLASLMASGGPTHYIDAWMNAANYRDDRIFRLYVALFIVDFMSEHGQEFNGNVLTSSVDCRNRLLRVFAACAQRID
jgi:hypothetical protein